MLNSNSKLMEVISLDKMTLFDHLVDIDERENSAIRGTLRCTCGNEYFNIYYFGKRTRGILAPDIIKQKGKINILAYCDKCMKSYGFNNYNKPKIQFNDNSHVELDMLSYDDQYHKVRFSFNYFPEKFKSSQFEEIKVEILKEPKQKWRMIVEE